MIAQALLISGTVGAGKTTTAEVVAALLADRSVPHALVDLDWLRRSWPVPAYDPFNFAVELANLHAVAQNFLSAGASRLVLAGVLETPEARTAYERALGIPLTVVRLRVGLDLVQRRLQRRHVHDTHGLRWHLHRSGELHEVLESAHVEDLLVEVGEGESPESIGAAVLERVGWGR